MAVVRLYRGMFRICDQESVTCLQLFIVFCLPQSPKFSFFLKPNSDCISPPVSIDYTLRHRTVLSFTEVGFPYLPRLFRYIHLQFEAL